MTPSSSRPGYAFLVTVLLIGAVASTVVASLLLLAAGTAKNSLAVQESAGALDNARSCAERALYLLRSDGSYAGGDTLSFTLGTCRILTVGGEGNAARTLCVEGTVGEATRRLEIEIGQLIPTVSISSWREVPTFSLCS